MKTRVFLLLLFLFCLSLALGATGTEADGEGSQGGLTASVTPPSARVGDVVTLLLQYVLPEGARLPDKAGIKGLEGLTILDLENIPSAEKTLSGEIRIRLLVDRLGSLTTGPLSVTFMDKEGGEAVLNAEPVSLPVLSNLGEKPEEALLKPIYGIIPTGFRWMKEVLWGSAILLLCLLAAGFWWWRKGRGKREAQEKARVFPHVAARESIRDLEGERLFERGQLKVFYFRFSEILRRYLEELRGFPAVEFTTQEIALAMKDGKDRELLGLLRQADLVKFADFRPTQARKEEEVKKALGYIDNTCELFEKEMDHSSKKKTRDGASIRKRLRGRKRLWGGRRFR